MAGCTACETASLKDLQVTMDRPETVVQVFGAAIKRYPRGAPPPEPRG